MPKALRRSVPSHICCSIKKTDVFELGEYMRPLHQVKDPAFAVTDMCASHELPPKLPASAPGYWTTAGILTTTVTLLHIVQFFLLYSKQLTVWILDLFAWPAPI